MKLHLKTDLDEVSANFLATPVHPPALQPFRPQGINNEPDTESLAKASEE